MVGELAAAGFSGIEAIYGRYSPRRAPSWVSWPVGSTWWPPAVPTTTAACKPDLRVGTGRGDLKVPDRVLSELESRRPRLL